MISKSKIIPGYTTIIYGVLMGASILLLQLINYRTLLYELPLQTYGLILILLGFGLGAWLAYYFMNSEKRKSIEIRKVVIIASCFYVIGWEIYFPNFMPDFATDYQGPDDGNPGGRAGFFRGDRNGQKRNE